jgi:type II secretion system protein N
MIPVKKAFVYFTYLIITTVFFLYIFFPSSAVRTYIEGNLNRINPDLGVSMGHIQPSLPYGLRIYPIHLNYQDIPLFNAENLKISPTLLSLLHTDKTFSFRIEGGGGFVDGKAKLAGGNTDRKINIVADLSDIRVEDIPLIERNSNYKLSGKLDGEATFARDSALPGVLSARLVLSDCRLDMLTSPFDLEGFAFSHIKIEFTVHDSQVLIQKCLLEGFQLNAELSGSVDLRAEIGESTLNILCRITPHPSFLQNLKDRFPVARFFQKPSGKNGFPLRLTGTLKKPGFELN